MSGFCFCCLTTADKVDIVMKSFGKINSLSQIEESDFPQFVCGRILPVASLLEAPVSGKPCVYYEARAEELVERNDENGLTGEVDGNKIWELRCAETVAADFTLYDPSFPSISIYVPGTQVTIKVHALEDAKNSSHSDRSKLIKHPHLPQCTKDFLARHNVKNSPDFRFREASFEYGEQIAVLGIVKKITDDTGKVSQVLFPVGKEVLTEEFCKSKGWSDWDIRSWRDLTENPSIILTDMPQYFQDIQVSKITKKSFAMTMPIDLKPYLTAAQCNNVHHNNNSNNNRPQTASKTLATATTTTKASNNSVTTTVVATNSGVVTETAKINSNPVFKSCDPPVVASNVMER